MTSKNVGIFNNRAKLNEQKVVEIRRLYRAGWTQVRLAKRFGVTQQTISRVVTLKYWRHVREPLGVSTS